MSESVDTPDPKMIFSSLLYPRLSEEDISVLTEFFEFIDANGDGLVDIDEIRSACQIDINSDGIISESEKDQAARVWIRLYLDREDISHSHLITLADLLSFNNRYIGQPIHFRGALANY